MNLKSTKQLFPYVLCCFFLVSIGLTSCGDDEEMLPIECISFPSIEGTIDINGETLALSIAQRNVIATGEIDGDQYIFSLGGVSADCITQSRISLMLSVPSGNSLTGTYTIQPFLEADEDEVTGSFVTQSIEPIMLSTVDLRDGTLRIVDNGDASYVIDVDANLVGGGEISMSLEHQF